jgi:hypothetical protein
MIIHLAACLLFIDCYLIDLAFAIADKAARMMPIM